MKRLIIFYINATFFMMCGFVFADVVPLKTSTKTSMMRPPGPRKTGELKQKSNWRRHWSLMAHRKRHSR